jgi:MFS family permease
VSRGLGARVSTSLVDRPHPVLLGKVLLGKVLLDKTSVLTPFPSRRSPDAQVQTPFSEVQFPAVTAPAPADAISAEPPDHDSGPGSALSRQLPGQRPLVGTRLRRFNRCHLSGRKGSWRVLREPRFRAYFVGSTVSNLGTWLQNTAQLLVAYQLTHSAFDIGVITSLQFSGFLTVGPWAGSLADRLGRKKVLIASQLASAGIAAGLAGLEVSGHLTKGELGAGALLSGLAMTFALPVQTSMLSALVPDRDKKAALAMNMVSYNVGRTLAPVLCLAVLASIGTGWAFGLNAITFVFFAVTVAMVYPTEASDRHEYARPWAVLSIVIEHPRVMLLLGMVAAVTFADDPVLVLGPSLAHQIGMPNIWPAYFLAALGLGTVIGALFPAKHTPARRAVIPLAILAGSVIVFSLGVNAWVSVLAAVIAGGAGLMTGSAAQALLLHQVSAPRVIQVMALWAVAWAGTKPIASLADGWLASQVGLQWTALILAAPALSIAGIELFLGRDLRTRLKRHMWQINASRQLAHQQTSI